MYSLSKFNAAFFTPEGTGYLQRNFRATCSCGFVIDKAVLGIYKFAKVLACEEDLPQYYIA
jgi:hypothetical protein